MMLFTRAWRGVVNRSLITQQTINRPIPNRGFATSSFLSHQAGLKQEKNTSVKELNTVLGLIANRQLPSSWLGSVEERLLNILSIHSASNDEVVKKYLGDIKSVDYESLCQLFIQIANNKRRPVPILKAAAKLISSADSEDKPTPETIIATLHAIQSLSYPNLKLLERLFMDLKSSFEPKKLSYKDLSDLFRAINKLRWYDDELMMKILNYVQEMSPKQILNTSLAPTLINLFAYINFRSKEVKDFYRVMNSREVKLQEDPKRWLAYVWSLVALDLATESHIRSVLGQEFLEKIELPSQADVTRLLNIRAIARYKLAINDLQTDHLICYEDYQNNYGPSMDRFAGKMRTALTSVAPEPDRVRFGVPTPFGFKLDAEFHMNGDSEIIDRVEDQCIEKLIKSPRALNEGETRPCALIYVSYGDTITNRPAQPVGHRMIISEILKHIGYRTIYISEALINQEETSSALITRIRSSLGSQVISEFGSEST